MSLLTKDVPLTLEYLFPTSAMESCRAPEISLLNQISPDLVSACFSKFFKDLRNLYSQFSIILDIALGPRQHSQIVTSQTVKLIQNPIQSRTAFLKLEERKHFEKQNCFCKRKVQSKSFCLVPFPTPNSE